MRPATTIKTKYYNITRPVFSVSVTSLTARVRHIIIRSKRVRPKAVSDEDNSVTWEMDHATSETFEKTILDQARFTVKTSVSQGCAVKL